MVAEFASPWSSAIFDEIFSDLAESDEPKTVLPMKLAERHPEGEHCFEPLQGPLDGVIEPEASMAKPRWLGLKALWSHSIESGEAEVNTAPSWEEVLGVMGEEIQRIRHIQGLSLAQLRLRTQIPVYQLEALEAGAVERLPEAIFVRGFLQRVCTQLGPEGQALLAQLPPSPSEPQPILADWQQHGSVGERSSQTVHLSSAHLYVGYAALLAGAAGGVALSVQETIQVSQTETLLHRSGHQVYQADSRTHSVLRAPQLTVGVGVAPPESMMPEGH